MKLNDLLVENFRGITRIDVNLETCNYVTGPNGAGKTSFVQAIQYALLGHCYDSEGKQIENAHLLRNGADSGQIRLRLADPDATIRVTFARTKKAVEAKCVVSCADETVADRDALWRWLQLDPATAAVALSPGSIFSAGGLGQTLTHYLFSKAENADPLAHGDQTRFARALREFVGEHSLGRTPDPERIGKCAYEQRTIAKRTLARAEGERDAIKYESVSDAQGKPLDIDATPKAQKQLAHFEACRDAAIRAQGATPVDPAEIARLEAEIATAESELKALEKRAPKPPATESTCAIEVEIENADILLADNDTMMAALDIQINNLERSIGGEPCPNCGHAMDAAEITTAKAKHVSLMARAEKLEQEHNAYEGQRATLKKQLADMRERNEKSRADTTLAANAHNAACGDLRATIKAKRGALETLQRNAPEKYDGPSVPECDEKIARLTHIIDNLIALESWRIADEAVRAQREAVTFLDWAVAEFRDGEFQRRALAAPLAEFIGNANAALQPHGFAIEADPIEKSWELQLVTAGRALPVRVCSESERTIAQYAVVDGIGFPVLILDDVDGCEARRKSALICDAKESDLQTILCGAWVQAPDPDIDALRDALAPVALVWIENGEAK